MEVVLHALDEDASNLTIDRRVRVTAALRYHLLQPADSVGRELQIAIVRAALPDCRHIDIVQRQRLHVLNRRL